MALIQIKDVIHAEFKSYCAGEGKSMSKVITDMIVKKIRSKENTTKSSDIKPVANKIDDTPYHDFIEYVITNGMGELNKREFEKYGIVKPDMHDIPIDLPSGLRKTYYDAQCKMWNKYHEWR